MLSLIELIENQFRLMLKSFSINESTNSYFIDLYNLLLENWKFELSISLLIDENVGIANRHDSITIEYLLCISYLCIILGSTQIHDYKELLMQK